MQIIILRNTAGNSGGGYNKGHRFTAFAGDMRTVLGGGDDEKAAVMAALAKARPDEPVTGISGGPGYVRGGATAGELLAKLKGATHAA